MGVVLQSADGPLDLGAAPVAVAVAVEDGGSAACAASSVAVGPSVLRLREGVASSYAPSVAARAVGLVATDVVGPGPGPGPRSCGRRAVDPHPVQDLDHLRGAAPLTRREQGAIGRQPRGVDADHRPGRRPPGPPASREAATPGNEVRKSNPPRLPSRCSSGASLPRIFRARDNKPPCDAQRRSARLYP